MARRPPRCPDCGAGRARQIVYGEPPEELARRAERGELVLGGCVLSDHDPAWDCPECGRRFGNRETPGHIRERAPEEWLELIRTMLPAPVQTNEAGELLGGDPVIVMARVGPDEISVMEASIEWRGPHNPILQGQPFAKVPLRTPAARVAELISTAWGKRVSQYRWCPRCQRTVQPEHMNHEKVCDGCASRVFGVVF